MTQLPDRINRLDELAHDLWWSWTPDARSVFRRLDYPLWRQTAHNPVRMLQLIPPRRARARGRRSRVARASTTARSPARRGARRAATRGASASIRELAGQVDRLLLRRVRAAPVAADLRRRPRRARRRSLQGSERPRRAAHRRRLHVSAGLLPPEPLVRRMAGGGLREAELDRRADRAGAHARRQAVRHRGAARQSHGARGGVARARRPREAVSARHRPRGERAVGSRAVGAPLRRRPRDARAAGNHPRHRRRARAEGDGHRPGASITSTKATPRSSCCSASATCASRGWTFDAALEEVRRTTVFTTHTPVAAGHDAFPFHLVETHLAGAWGDLGGYRERFLALGHYDNGGGPMFNMTALALRTGGAVNGVSQLHGEVTKQMWQSIWPGTPVETLPVQVDHQRRARADVDVGGDRRAARDVTSAPTGSSVTTTRRCAIACCDIPDEELWAARAGAARRSSSSSSASGRASAGRTEGVRRGARRRRRHDVRSQHADDRLRAPLHRLQAARADLHRSRSPGAHPQRAGPRRCSSSSPARRIRPTTSASITCSGSTGARSTRSSAGASRFVDDYDLHVAHFLVQGCDVWMNNPRKPLEASGTSGMKAAINGTPHMSIGDGWWAEGLHRRERLADRRARPIPNDHGAQDWADAQALYTLHRGAARAGVLRPRRARASRAAGCRSSSSRSAPCCPRFSARRMVKEYVREMYVPALREPVAR